MSKRFYVVISYAGIGGKGLSATSLASLFAQKSTEPVLYQDQFDRYRTEVYNRAAIVGNGLSHVGLKLEMLDTQKLIELFYGIYNPDLATEERLTDIDTMKAGIVSSPNSLAPQEPTPTAELPVDPPPTQS